jgi:NitT/TauT family transport system substrate-binding protein
VFDSYFDRLTSHFVSPNRVESQGPSGAENPEPCSQTTGRSARINYLWKHTGLLLTLASLLQTCACVGIEQPQPEPTTLKVAILPYLSFAPFFIAEEEGYFAEQGIQIEFVRLAPQDSTPALAQGEVDVSAGLVTAGLLNAIARGGKIRIVADQEHIDPVGCPQIALVARRSLVEAGGLENPEQMEGKQVDVLPASWNNYYLATLIATVGLTPDDLALTNIPSAAEIEALDKGTLDMSTIGEPWLTRMLQAGHTPILAPVQEVMPDSQVAVILYSSRLLDENPDAGKRFMIAYLEAVRQYNRGKTERNLELLAELTELDQAVLEEACLPAIRNDGTINVESVLDFQDWAVEAGFIESLALEEQLWDPSFVEYANEVLGTPSQ